MKMNYTLRYTLGLVSLATVAMVGCKAPGAPGPAEERPDEVKDFQVLYKQNCAACHGEQGRGGIATSMANPVYLAIAGHDAIAKAVDEGGPGALMPAFGQKHGGFLTHEQVEILTNGMIQNWGKAHALAGATAPSYAATLTGDPAAGKVAFANTCARCHQQSVNPAQHSVGSVTDADFLGLISDQNLRTTILAGKPDEGMPDWRGYGSQPLTDQQVTDIVSWMGTLRHHAAAAKPATASTTAPAPVPTSNPQGEQK